MSGVTQATFMNQRSFGPPAIGEAFGGGFFAGQIGVSGVATHNLVVGPLSTAEFTGQWKTSNTLTSGTDSFINGPQNTAIANNTSHPCARFCSLLVLGGFSNWYMPARNELEVCYFNLKPTTTGNQTGSGKNPNAVPARSSNYTSGTPARTSPVAFRSGGAQAFATVPYWSSTMAGGSSYATHARNQLFGNGQQRDSVKIYSTRVRAVRRVAV